MNKHRHSRDEILTKLQLADRMVAEGKLHQDIVRALEVSVMTYHRWRKANRSPQSDMVLAPSPRPDIVRAEQRRIGELQIENSRLCRLITDLLLEKIRIEEEQASRGARARPRNGHAVI